MNDPKWRNEYDAPEGQVWVCGVCGRRAKNRVNVGDDSCFRNAVLCYDDPTPPLRLVLDTRE